MKKPNCYECKYRGDIPGSAHSCCKHPANAELLNNPLAQMLGIFASVGRVAPVRAKTKLNIKGHSTGIRRGWFNWPMNFDPVWLEECDGFSKKDIKK